MSRREVEVGNHVLLLRPEDEPVPYAVRMLSESLDASGSEMAAGTGGSGPGSVAALASAVAAATPLRLPALLEHGELSATLWSRSFWQEHRAALPQDPALERAFVARALLRAPAVDVVPEPVTSRQAGVVETGLIAALRVEDLSSVADRLDDLHEVARSIPERHVRSHWETAVLEPELRSALGHLVEADHALAARLVERAAQVLEDAPDLGADGRAIQRLVYHLARRRLLPQLLEVLRADRSGELTLLRSVQHRRAHYGDYPFRNDGSLGIPPEVYRLDRELAVRARVEHLRWEGETLHIEGFAHLGLVDVDGPRSGRLRLSLVRSGPDGPVMRLPVERVHRPDVTADAREAAYTYDWSGFRTSVRAADLRGRSGWSYGVWRLEATASGAGEQRSRYVSATTPGAARHPAWLEGDGVRIVPTTGRGTFAVEVDTLPASLTSVESRASELVLVGEVRRKVAADGSARLLVSRPSGSMVLPPLEVRLELAGSRRRFRAALPLADLAAAAGGEARGAGRWALRLQLPGVERTVPLRAAEGLPALSSVVRTGAGTELEVELGTTAHGRVTVSCGPPLPHVESARWDGNVLELTGRWAGHPDELCLVSQEAARRHVLAPEVSGGRFTLRLEPGAMPSLAGRLPLTQGTWRLLVRRQRDHDRRLAASRDVLAALPLRHRIGAKPFDLTEDDGHLHLAVGPDLREDERGAANQHRMHLHDVPRFVAAGLRDEVLFESYESRAYADNARAVVEELACRETGLRARWVVVDGQAALPPGLEAVRRNSRDYYEALARSRYVVVPNYRPLHSWLDTPRDQVVVQTWHGAPFKKIGLDNPRGAALGTSDYLDMLRRETARWNYLLSPNPPSSPILRRAFAYDGELLETGYPRTDVFFAADREARAEAVRQRLGIPREKRVVLYAPTMRDDRHYGGNRFSLDLRLDLRHARQELGEDHVLLVRRHAKVVDTVSSADGTFALDVSLWPDVNELLLAVDVLVTDYSSLLFDFATTSRPMLFFTYDLDDYRDRLRGLYFDPLRLPGPHLRTSEEVVAAIRAVDGHHREHAETYRLFVDEFCPWDDGSAAARFVDRVFADHLG